MVATYWLPQLPQPRLPLGVCFFRVATIENIPWTELDRTVAAAIPAVVMGYGYRKNSQAL